LEQAGARRIDVASNPSGVADRRLRQEPDRVRAFKFLSARAYG
jgi:hypothetical protein